MIIAIPSILGTMSDAQRGTFKIYAEKVLNKAQEKYQSDIMLNSTAHEVDEGVYCYDLEEGLNMTSTGNYRGYVLVYLDEHLNPEFSLFLSDNNFGVYEASYESIQDTESYGDPTEFEGCSVPN